MLLSFMIQHYFAVQYENFTAKIISAYAILKIVDDAKKEDIERVEWIQKNTHKDIRVSIWKLDRAINPTKGEFSMVVNKRRFSKNKATETERNLGKHTVELTEDSMQHYLCEAINEVHNIVVRNIKGYKEEIPFGLFFNSDTKKDVKDFEF